MNDSELCKMFGTTVEQVEVDCEKYESGDFSGWELGKPIDGRPKAPMNAADDKTYTVSSREVIYKGACNDVDLNPYRDAVLWYVGNDRDEALRIARKYAADVRDTGKVEVCKNGISRNVFEVCETQLDEDGDIVDEDTIETVDPLDRMPSCANWPTRQTAASASSRATSPASTSGSMTSRSMASATDSTASSFPLSAISARTPTTAAASGFPPLSMISTSRTPPSSRKCSKRCAASGGRTGRVMTSSTRLSTSYSPPSANARLEHFETGAVAWSHPSLRKA